jgi:hypothetical protein
MKVNFRIERLVVEGASQAEGRRVAEALQEHLAQLARTGFSASGLARPGLSDSGGAGRSIRLARLDGGSVEQGAGPEEIGRHVAGKIAGQIAGQITATGIGRQVLVQAGGRRG